MTRQPGSLKPTAISDVNSTTGSPFKYLNRPFPSSLVPLFQSDSKCKTFHIKMSSAYRKMVSHLDSLWNWGTRELGNGLFWFLFVDFYRSFRPLSNFQSASLVETFFISATLFYIVSLFQDSRFCLFAILPNIWINYPSCFFLKIGKTYSGYQSHAPLNDFFPFQKLSFGQSNVSMTIVVFISSQFDHRWIRYNRSVIMTTSFAISLRWRVIM